MKVVILAGGLGTRLAEETSVRPKPMVEIGGRPILDHIMRWYAHHGYKEFIVALGYKGEFIKQYFLNYYPLNSDISVSLGTGEVIVHEREREDWIVHLVETGTNTMTGGRLARLRPWLTDDTFMLTYGDGLADVDLHALCTFHQTHGRLATVTAVRPPARFGELVFDGDMVARFTEKPQTGEGWINGGFFVLSRSVLDYIDGDQTPWEAEPMQKLAWERQLYAFRHAGFWQPMDTLREKQFLEELWNSGQAPWTAVQS
ncbi:MAG: glucose-1-phosphate cytidylyltransferase [Caldilinea sp.]|nr:glucose-1-phosphate cytidylyltransferase [Caldilineaceae bacterium]MCO5211881.1 glucose-1-phosphate cytidylyltransferase [Caldilinea sp.]MCW5841175.1 glucose-1-phosphate cytidylyltransferase [Caldilinea sp.]